MPDKGRDIRHQLHLARPRRSTTNTARKRDHQTAMPTLIRPDFQQFRPHQPVKPGPVKAVIGVMHFAGHRGHQRHHIVLARRQGGNGLGKHPVVNFHRVPFLIFSSVTRGPDPSQAPPCIPAMLG